MLTVAGFAAAGTIGMASAARGAAVLNFSSETVYGGNATVVTAVDDNNPATQYWKLAIGNADHINSDFRGRLISFIDLTGATPSHDYSDASLDGDGPYGFAEAMFSPTYSGGTTVMSATTNGVSSYSWTLIDDGGDGTTDNVTTYTVHAPDATGTLIEAMTTITWNAKVNVIPSLAVNGYLLGSEAGANDGTAAAGSDIWEVVDGAEFGDGPDGTAFLTVGVKNTQDAIDLNLTPGRTFSYRVSGENLADRDGTYDDIGSSYINPRGYGVFVEGATAIYKPSAGDVQQFSPSLLINIAIPEPASVVVLMLGGVGLLASRRRAGVDV